VISFILSTASLPTLAGKNFWYLLDRKLGGSTVLMNGATVVINPMESIISLPLLGIEIQCPDYPVRSVVAELTEL
jgi:hypothetical protein